MDNIYLDFPTYGSRGMSHELKRRGFKVGRSKARSLMRILGIEAIYPRMETEFSGEGASDLSLSSPGGNNWRAQYRVGSGYNLYPFEAWICVNVKDFSHYFGKDISH